MRRSPPRTSIRFQPKGSLPDDAASAYERELKSFYGAERLDPARPLVRRHSSGGSGRMAMTAHCSLTRAVLAERDRWVAAVVAQIRSAHHADLSRMESSRNAAFLVSGEESARRSRSFAAR